jgi:hypothetical protein
MRFSDWRKFAGLVALLVFVCVAALLILTPRDASGQQEPAAPVAPDQPAPGAQAARRMAMVGMMGGTPAIAVADGKVYVVLGGTLYKFNAETLELEGQNTFVERPAIGAMGFAGGRGRRAGQPAAPAPAAPQ